MGTVVLGKLESGSICKGQQLVMMPNKVRIHNALVHLNFLLKSISKESELFSLRDFIKINHFFVVVFETTF